jgi:heterodisulfide reductase subunit B
LPVFYFTELMGLAFGLPDVRKWLKKHLLSPVEILKKRQLL